VACEFCMCLRVPTKVASLCLYARTGIGLAIPTHVPSDTRGSWPWAMVRGIGGARTLAIEAY